MHKNDNDDLTLELYVEEISDEENFAINNGCCWSSAGTLTSASTFGSCGATASSSSTASCSC
ncbi:thiocillin family RiPP [Macrococcus equi]|uniref:thiocillin family RiPP n=1 Tax=Macrococcus equi TaxID=3395462 RepID=UPI0039BE0DB7